jgi:ABC-type dipeptide/oligopeptide/nickel transport system permease component
MFLGLLAFGAVPGLFNGVSLSISGFINQLTITFSELLHPWQIMYTNPTSFIQRPIFPEIFTSYFYSLEIYFGALITAFILAMLISYWIVFMKKKNGRIVRFFVFLFESLPDVFVIVIAQLLTILIYQKTHILLMNVAAVSDNYAYAMPILSLSVIPTMFFIRVILVNMEDELSKPYVEMAKSKGLSKQIIIYKHVTRNSLISVFYNARSIMWLMLSNLFMLEYIFNIYGITQFVLTYYTPAILTIAFLMLFIPIYVFLAVCEWLITKLTGQEVAY